MAPGHGLIAMVTAPVSSFVHKVESILITKWTSIASVQVQLSLLATVRNMCTIYYGNFASSSYIRVPLDSFKIEKQHLAAAAYT